MNIWEKIKSKLSEGVETISDKTSEWSHIAKLRWEEHNIQRSLEQSKNELGGKVYQLHVEQRESQLIDETKEIIQKIKTFDGQLENKKSEIQQIIERGVDARQLKEFRKDLELGDGKIEQIVVDESSKIVGKKLLEVKFPKNVLVGAIVRNEHVIIPDGKTFFQSGDKVTLLGEKDDVAEATQILSEV